MTCPPLAPSPRVARPTAGSDAAPAFTAKRALALTLCLLLAGCASAPETRRHSLLPGPVAAPASPAAPVAAQLVSVRVPLAVDQPQWLVRLPDQSLRLLEQERWTSPLRDELRAALREHLARQWGLQEPAPGAAPGWRIEVEVQRFESLPGQSAWLGGRYTVSAVAPAPAAPVAAGQAPATGLACAFSLQQPVAAGPLALAEGHRLALARLAAQIGQGLQALAAGRRADCATE